jgi:hypothetical protein
VNGNATAAIADAIGAEDMGIFTFFMFAFFTSLAGTIV